MPSWHEIAADLRRNWLTYASMPFVAAIIGYVTKVLAIDMMFRPIDFVGLNVTLFGRKPFGWQGIVPRRAEIMARIACSTITERLVRPEDVFGRLDPAEVAKAVELPLLDAVEEITRQVAATYAPGLWEAAPERVRRLLVDRVQQESPNVVRQIMTEIQADVGAVFDLEAMVVTALLRDRPLLNRIFLEAGSGEFRFIRRSGLAFGFAIGCVQAVAWALTRSTWVLPAFGLFTGWFTDWLALKMIFRPIRPKKYLGLFEWQGLFLKRRREVAAAYGRLIAREIVTPRNIIDAAFKGPLSDRLFLMVHRHVQRVIDEQAGVFKPIVVLAVGSTRYQEMKRVVARRIMDRLSGTMVHVEPYATRAMDIENTLVTRMQDLNEEEFERLLHPVFEQDEWMLIAAGAILGFLVGELQVVLMLHHG